MGKNIYINRIIKKTKVEGYGNRYCIWVQGCSIRCPGCANKEMWDRKKGNIYTVSHILKEIDEMKGSIEGITFLGGEPFEQAEAVAEIAKVAQEGGLSVIIFTGFTYDAILKSENLIWLNLLKHIDLLIDGPYVEEKREFSRPWVGSSNQNFYYLTDCFKEEEKSLETIKNKIEIRIETNGEISINGMGDYKKVMNILMEQNRRSNGKDKN